MKRLVAIVPAAGGSSRFGSHNKLLEAWDGLPMVVRVVRTLESSGLPTLTVVGYEGARVGSALAPSPTVFNEAWRDGLGTSIACGVRAAGDADGFLVALGDMPELRPEVVRALVAKFAACPDDAILAVAYAGAPNRPGHPVVFGCAYRNELERLDGDEGARRILAARGDRLELVPASGSLPDIDFRKDLA